MNSINIIDFINKEKELPVYFLLGKGFGPNRPKDYYQFLLRDRTLNCITEEELEIIEDDKFLIVSEIDKVFTLNEDYNYCTTTIDDFSSESYLLVSKTVEIVDKIEKNKHSDLSDTIDLPLGIFKGRNVESDNKLYSNGTQEYFMYGPYINIQQGSYKFIIEMELINSTQDNLGFIDIFSGSANNVFFKEEINRNRFDNEKKLTFEAPFTLGTDISGLELRAYANEGTQIKINKVYLQYQGMEISLVPEAFKKFPDKVIEGDNLYIQSNGKEGIFMYGPYMPIKHGEYSLSLDIEIIDYINNELGWVDVYSNSTRKVFYKQIIYVDDLDENNKLHIIFPIEFDKDLTDIEIRAYANDGTQMRISNVRLK